MLSSSSKLLVGDLQRANSGHVRPVDIHEPEFGHVDREQCILPPAVLTISIRLLPSRTVASRSRTGPGGTVADASPTPAIILRGTIHVDEAPTVVIRNTGFGFWSGTW